MKHEEILKIINQGLKVDGINVKAKDVVSTVPNEALVATLSYLLGYLEIK